METKNFEIFDLIYALDNAAEFLLNEEWPEDDGGNQVRANKKAAKMIIKMKEKVEKKNIKINNLIKK